MKNHETELPSTHMHEKEDKLEFQVKNIVIPNDPETAHGANEMEEEELVQEEDNDKKKTIDDRKTNNKKIVNTQVGTRVVMFVFKKRWSCLCCIEIPTMICMEWITRVVS